jgi:hypothetical protein
MRRVALGESVTIPGDLRGFGKAPMGRPYYHQAFMT